MAQMHSSGGAAAAEPVSPSNGLAWLYRIMGMDPPSATRTPMSAKTYKEVTSNVVFRTPQKKSASVAYEVPASNNHSTLACRVRWYNRDKGWGYAAPQQIHQSDVRLTAAVIHAAGLDRVAAGDLFMVTFDRTQPRPNAIKLSPIKPTPCGQKNSLLDLLDDFCLSIVLNFVNAFEGGQSLCSMARFCLAYRRAFMLEREFHYGHILLGCQLSYIPPLRWFQQRKLRISSITSAVLPQQAQAALHSIWHPIAIHLRSTRNEEYTSIKK